MNKELFAEINKLPVDYPGINLMEKDSMAGVEYLGKHRLDNWVPCHASLRDSIQ